MKFNRINSNLLANSRLCKSGKYFTFYLLLLFLAGFSYTLHAQTGAYTLNGGTASQSGQTYAATLTDESAVYTLNSAQLTLMNCTLTKTGDASNVNNSSQYGINAGILATSASKVICSGGSVTTNAGGANGIFAIGTSSSITMSNSTINASGSGAHGLDVTYGGSITLTNVDITTTGSNSSAIATDFGGGTVSVTGGTIIASATTSGSHSAGIYSTGNISVYSANVTSSGDCGGVIDGANSISLTNTNLTGALHGFKTWKTAPASGSATITMTGGSLTATAGDGFYITGETGNASTTTITLSGGATISAGTGNIANVISSSTATLTAKGETLSGNLHADATSTLSVSLQNSTSLTGNAQNTGLTMDVSSSWTVTENSIMTTVVDPGGISGLTVTNIIGNGNSVHYNSNLASNQYLGGLTYSLVNGGVLTPGNLTGMDELQAANTLNCQLYQNSPNPARSLTTIYFKVGQTTHVALKIFNQLGTLMAVMADSDQEAGLHEFSLDASLFQSGIYYCALFADGIVETKKMIFER